MKKFSLVLMSFMLLALTILPLSASAASSDFRNVKWGMSTKQVKKLEKDKIIETNTVKKFSYITYSTMVATMSSELTYLFYNNKLVRTVYFVDTLGFSTSQDKLNSYYVLKDVLTEKYGKPTNSKDLFELEGSSGLTNDNALDLSLGNIGFKSRWVVDNGKTEVIMYLDRYESQPRLRIMYSDRKNNLDIDKLMYSDGL